MSKPAKPKPKIWAVLNRDRFIELYVGPKEPFLDRDFISAPRGTRFLGQLTAAESANALGFDLHKIGKPVEVSMTIEPLSKR